MEDKEMGGEYEGVNVNQVVTSILDSIPVKVKESKEIEVLKLAEILNTPTPVLIETMMGICSIPKDNLTANQNDMRRLISQELKNRAKTDNW